MHSQVVDIVKSEDTQGTKVMKFYKKRGVLKQHPPEESLKPVKLSF